MVEVWTESSVEDKEWHPRSTDGLAFRSDHTGRQSRNEAMRLMRYWVPVVLMASGPVGCGVYDSQPPTEGSERVDTVEVRNHGPFAEAWQGERFFELQQQDDLSLIAFLRDAVVTQEGEILVADPSEGNVKVFSSEGRFLRAIGRLGDGPGEFRQLIDIRLTASGQLAALDLTHRTIQVFSLLGELTQRLGLQHIPNPTGMLPLEDSLWVVLSSGAGIPGIAGEVTDLANVVRFVNRNGDVLESLLPLGGLLPTGDDEPTPYWDMMRHFWIEGGSSEIFVTSTLRPEIWIVRDFQSSMSDHQETGFPRVQRTVMQIPGYSRPEPPPHLREFRIATDLAQWFYEHYEWIGRPSMTTVGLFVPLNRSRFLGEGPARIVHFPADPDEVPHVYSDAPTVIGHIGDSIYAVTDPRAESVTIGVYTKR
jgi:hypothetical protein